MITTTFTCDAITKGPKLCFEFEVHKLVSLEGIYELLSAALWSVRLTQDDHALEVRCPLHPFEKEVKMGYDATNATAGTGARKDAYGAPTVEEIADDVARDGVDGKATGDPATRRKRR